MQTNLSTPQIAKEQNSGAFAEPLPGEISAVEIYADRGRHYVKQPS